MKKHMRNLLNFSNNSGQNPLRLTAGLLMSSILDVQISRITHHWPGWYDKVGNTKFDNTTNLNKKDNKIEFINSFKRNYHNYIAAFRKLESFYMKFPGRKFPDIPLRIETDRFL